MNPISTMDENVYNMQSYSTPVLHQVPVVHQQSPAAFPQCDSGLADHHFFPCPQVGPGVSGARDLVGARDSKVNYADHATWLFTPNDIGQFFLNLIWIIYVSVLAKSCYNLAILIVKNTSTHKQVVFYAIIIFTSLIIALENSSKLVWAGLFKESILILLELFTQLYGALVLLGFCVLFKHYNKTEIPTPYAGKRLTLGVYQYFCVIAVLFTLLLTFEYGGKNTFKKSITIKILLLLSEQCTLWCIKKYSCVARHVQHELQFFKVIKEIMWIHVCLMRLYVCLRGL
ncbi:hypothetical protein Tco_0864786 [Tanacetum coccineum]